MAKQRAQKLELGYSGFERREHEISDTKEAEARGGARRGMGAQDKVEDLDDVVIALEVGQRWMLAQHLEDDIGKLAFSTIKLFF